MMAEVNSEVVADPPISAVLTLPALMTSKVAAAMLLAMESSLDKFQWSCTRIGVSHKPEMSQHHSGGQDHGSRVSAVSTHQVGGNVTTSWLKESVFLNGVA